MRSATGKTDIGALRDKNEDSVLILNSAIGRLQNLFIVADGMGGHNAGEVASSKAIEYFCEYAEKHTEFRYTEALLADAIRYANEHVYSLSLEGTARRGMGTTFTAASCDDANLYFGHVGDSRIYVVTRDGIQLLTSDHTYVNELVRAGVITEEESASHPDRNVLLRALGTDDAITVDEGYYPLKGVERFVLCSDGLTSYLRADDILEIVNSDASDGEKVARMIDEALNRGGADNISVILL